MKATTLNNRIAKALALKNGKIAVKYSFFADFLVAGKWHGKSWNGSGRYINLSDTQYRAAIEICEKLGLDFEVGNDAPRGGKSGDFVALTAKGKRQVAAWVKSEVARRAEIARVVEEKRAARTAEGEARVEKFLAILNENKETVFEVLGKHEDGEVVYRGLHELAGRLHCCSNRAFHAAVNKFYNPQFEYNARFL